MKITDGEISKKIFGEDSEKSRKLLSDLRQYGMVKPFRSSQKLGSNGWSSVKDVRSEDTNWIVPDKYLKYLFDEEELAFMRTISD